MSRPTPIVLIMVGVGLGLFGLRIFGVVSLQYEWVLALSICLEPISKLRIGIDRL
jgi:hypothetical protein